MSQHSIAINELANGQVKSKDQSAVINNDGMNPLELKHQDPNGSWVSNNLLVDSTNVSSDQRQEVYVNCNFSQQGSYDRDPINTKAANEGLCESTTEEMVVMGSTKVEKGDKTKICDAIKINTKQNCDKVSNRSSIADTGWIYEDIHAYCNPIKTERRNTFPPCADDSVLKAHSYKTTGSHDQSSDEIKKEMRKVIGNLEGVLDELKHVVGDLRTVVDQIDDVTTQIEGVRGKDVQKNGHPASVPNSSSNRNCAKKRTSGNSLDSGFMDSGGGLDLKAFALHTSTYKDGQTDLHISDSKLSHNKGGCLQKHNNTAKSISSTNVSQQPFCRKCHHFHCHKAPSDSNNSNSLSFKLSVANKAGKKKQQGKYSNRSLGSPNLALKNKDLVGDGLSTGRSIPPSTCSDNSDFYERQLDQRLENISGAQDTFGASRAEFYGTFDGLPLTMGKKSYSDTLFSALNENRDSFDTAYDSDTSEEGSPNCTDKTRDNVMKPSDTFRFKVRQIGLRRARAANWRVIIEP